MTYYTLKHLAMTADVNMGFVKEAVKLGWIKTTRIGDLVRITEEEYVRVFNTISFNKYAAEKGTRS